MKVRCTICGAVKTWQRANLVRKAAREGAPSLEEYIKNYKCQKCKGEGLKVPKLKTFDDLEVMGEEKDEVEVPQSVEVEEEEEEEEDDVENLEKILDELIEDEEEEL